MNDPSVSQEKNCILIVDDDAINRELLKNIFSEFCTEEAANGEEGIAALARVKDSLCAILLDVDMPHMNGIEMLRHLCESGIPEKVPVFLITSNGEAAVAREAYALGVMDVLAKPVTPFVVRRRVCSVVELFATREKLSETVEGQRAQIYADAHRIDELHRGTIEALAAAIEFRDVESGEHTGRIYSITKLLLTRTEMGAGLTEDEIESIAVASIMHDIGKIAISDVILNKPGRLSPDEFDIMKGHAAKGAVLMEQLARRQAHPSYRYALDIARHHHERWDGSGYPDGLAGEEISPWAQIVSIADVYDALISPRVYKRAVKPEEAVEMIRRGECGVFSEKLLDAFLSVEGEIRQMYTGTTDGTVNIDSVAVAPQIEAARHTAQIAGITREGTENLLILEALHGAYDLTLLGNLTKNSYRMLDYERYLNLFAAPAGSYDELIRAAAESIPPGEEREQVVARFSRASLLAAYASGQRNIMQQHDQYGKDGKVHRMETRFLMMEDVRTGDVLCVTLSRSVECEMERRREASRLLEDAASIVSESQSTRDALRREVNEPLNAILADARTVRDTAFLPEVRETAARMEAAAENLLAISARYYSEREELAAKIHSGAYGALFAKTGADTYMTVEEREHDR